MHRVSRSVAAISVVLLTLGCGGSPGASGSEGSGIDLSSVRFEVLGWESKDTYPKTLRVEDGNHLVGVSYFAVNRGEAMAAFTAMSFKLEDGDGNVVRTDISATSILGKGAMGEPLLPGEPHRGTLWFEVPEDAKDLTLVYLEGKKNEKKIALADAPGLREPPAELTEAVSIPATDPGESASIEGWEITVTGAHPVKEIGHTQPGEGSIALGVDLDAKNVSGDEKKFRLLTTVRLKDASGMIHGYVGEPGTPEEIARKAIAGGMGFMAPAVAVGESKHFVLGFLVPADAGPLYLIVDPSPSEMGKAMMKLPEISGE